MHFDSNLCTYLSYSHPVERVRWPPVTGSGRVHVPENPVCSASVNHTVVCVQVQLGVQPVIGIAESLFLR